MKKVKGKYIRLTESQLKQIINESVTNMLLEYACERSEFVDNTKHQAQQIVENWCLVKYRTLTNTTENKNHWSGELYNAIDNIGRDKLKDNNKYTARVKAITQGFQKIDIFTPEGVIDRINAKFVTEKIDVDSPIVWEVANQFTHSVNEIIDLIANFDRHRIHEYTHSI